MIASLIKRGNRACKALRESRRIARANGSSTSDVKLMPRRSSVLAISHEVSYRARIQKRLTMARLLGKSRSKDLTACKRGARRRLNLSQ
eukprot:751310-Hanusia_phi.AAC.4